MLLYNPYQKVILIISFITVYIFAKESDEKDSSSFVSWGTNCNFNEETNGFRCDVPKFKNNFVVYANKKSYNNKLFVSQEVRGQKDCKGTFSEGVAQSCHKFETVIATGKICESPTSDLFKKLKTSINHYCDSEDDNYVCARKNSACPDRANVAENCCVVLNCENVWSDCKLKVDISFSLIPSLIASTQNIPVLSSSLEINGEGFPDKDNLSIACFDSTKANIGCKVEKSGSSNIRIVFNSYLFKTGPIYANINSANALKGDDVKNLVQIGTVVWGSPFDYKYYIIGIVLVVFALIYLWKKNISSKKATVPAGGLRRGPIPYY